MADGLQGLIDQLGGIRRVTTLGVGIAAIALIVGVSRWATAPTWVPIVSGAPLESISEVTDRLDQATIPYKLERGGADIVVAVTDLPRARVAMAKGGLSTSARPGMEMFDNQALGMTDFTQRVNYRRALEGELERTIGKMRGVQSAQVHLAMHETSSFRSASTPSEASVMIKLSNGESPSAEVVNGIIHLVASSVDGLASDQVTVIDDAARLLSIPNEEGSLLGLTSRQLANQREIEDHLKGKAEELITQMVGRGNARVQVSASVNFDRVERTTHTLDPDKQMAQTEQKSEIVPGAQGGAASSSAATVFENARSTEIYAGALGVIRRLTVAVLINDKMTGTGDSVQFTPRPALEIARIESLVRSAVGFDSTRGDQVSVVSVPFTLPVIPVVAPQAAPTLIERVQENQSLYLNGAALLFAFVIGFLALRSVKQSQRLSRGTALTTTQQMALAPGNAAHQAMMPMVEEESLAPRMVPELAAMQANGETRNRVAATVGQQPDLAAKMARAWMKEA
ncbi:MAG: flagellar basal-body MS-ring/collar protein FliF [Gemmatimonadaceae bacterium]